MRIFLLVLLAVMPLRAADEQKLTLEAAAQADFDRVLAQAPDLASAAKCVQSQAMLFSIAAPEETAPVVFRKAYCRLAGAASTQDRAAFAEAAETFDDAIADREASAGKRKIPQPVPPTWRGFAAIARLKAGGAPESQEQALAGAVDAVECQSTAGLDAEFCQTVKQLGSAWLGWIAFGRGDLAAAARNFTASRAPGWTEWVAGAQAFHAANYVEASGDYRKAIEIWRGAVLDSLPQRLDPLPDMPAMLTEWGGAQLLANDTAGAIATLDAAVKADAANPRALYFRGLAKERAGRGESALEDYNLASRAAFARTGDAAAAEAHFYRGIMLYRRKDFLRAESEFSSVLNFQGEIPWRSDARVWRHMSAVAGGSCGASRDNLESSLASASPYFPKREALATLAACPVTDALAH
jgi:tetratricopeptide (TPR) repeat protein